MCVSFLCLMRRATTTTTMTKRNWRQTLEYLTGLMRFKYTKNEVSDDLTRCRKGMTEILKIMTVYKFLHMDTQLKEKTSHGKPSLKVVAEIGNSQTKVY